MLRHPLSIKKSYAEAVHNSSLVVHQLPVRGAGFSSPGKNNIFKLRLPPSQDKNAGGLELAGHLKK